MDWIPIITTIISTCITLHGINKWKEELREKANLEVSRGLLKATYKLREEIKYFLYHPSIDELPSNYIANGNSISQLTEEAFYYIYKNRWDTLNNATIEFSAQSLEAEVIWGALIREKCNVLINITTELLTLINENIGLANKKINIKSITQKRIKFSQEVSLAISGIEKELKKHLK